MEAFAMSVLALSTQELESLIPLTAICAGTLIAVVWIIFGTIYYSGRSKDRERTKREIAAYVAEGSMSPDEGERLLRAAGADADDE